MLKILYAVAACALLSGAALTQDQPLPVGHAANPAEVAIVGDADFVADRLIVRFVPGLDLDLARLVLDPARFELAEPLMPSIDLYLVRIADGTPVAAAIVELSASPLLRYAAPDHFVTQRSTTPNDPSYGQQWCHTKMQSALAWDHGQGSTDFVVSAVDGGCLLTHQDLADNLYTNKAELGGVPGFDDDGNGYIDDVHGWNAYSNNGNIPNDGHGTHVNGIIGARGNNGLGVAGVNWDVTLMPVAGSSGTTSIVVKAYNYVLAQKQLWLATGGALGANVVATNSSFGVDYGNCGSATYKAWNDSYEAMGAAGILSCGSTANININIDVVGDVPTGCASPYMVAVTNTTSTDTKNSGAAYGLTTIDLGAPGTNVYSTYSNGGYTSMTGTSMAGPQVAGAIGLLHSVASTDFSALRASDPAGAALVLKQVILDNVDPLADLTGKTVSGGRLNLSKAADAIAAWTGGASTHGKVEPYGIGLGGANVGLLASPSIPDIGTPVVFNATKFFRSTSVLMLVSTASTNAPIAGGTLLVSLPEMFALLTIGVSGGSGSLSLPIPNDAALVGFVFYAQCGGSDGTQPQGVALSNGIKFTIGQ